MIEISEGFEDEERPQLAALYWQAFGAKLGKVMGPPHVALRFISNNIDPEFALVARDSSGAVLGVAGFKTADGAFLGGGISEMAQVYGWVSTCWRVPILAVIERSLADDVLLMDGICVAEKARGQGVGSSLLESIKAKARMLECTSVRLDVIDTNPKARALYERRGFRPRHTEHLGVLSFIFGFSSSTQMLWSA